MRLFSPAMIATLVWIYILFITRPDEADLKEQLAAKGNLQPWPAQIFQTVMNTPPLSKHFGSLTTSTVSDYGVITVVWKPNKLRSDLILVGLLGRFLPFTQSTFTEMTKWNSDSDILLALFLHVVSLVLYFTAPRLAFRLYHVNLRRPWTLLLSSFSTQSVWSLIIHIMLLMNVGISVRNSLPQKQYPSIVFWALYSLIPDLSVFINQLVFDRRSTSMGGTGAAISLAAYGALSISKFKFSIFGGIKLGSFGVLILEACQYISFNPDRHPVSLLFDVFLVSAMAAAIFKIQHPYFIFDLDKIYDLTIGSTYAF